MSVHKATPGPGRRRDEITGVLWALLSAAIYTVIFAAEDLTGEEVSTTQLLFLRYSFAFLILLVLLPFTPGGLRGHRSEKPAGQFVAAVFGTIGAAAATQAPLYVPLIDSTAVSLLRGLIMVLLGAVLLGERIESIRWLGILIAFAGAVTVVLGEGAFSVSHGPGASLGVVLSLTAALANAYLGIATKTLTAHDRAMTFVLYNSGFSALITLGPALLDWKPIDVSSLWPFFLLGALTILGHFAYSRGFALAPASLVAPIGYSGLIFASLLGWLALAEVPTLISCVGVVVLILGGVLATLRSRAAMTGRAGDRPPGEADKRQNDS